MIDIEISRPAENVVLAKVSGRLDAAGATVADAKLRPLQAGPLAIIDLSGVDYLSSAGVRIFLSLHKSLESAEKKLILTELQPYCREVLKISGLLHVLHLSNHLDEALAQCAPRQSPFEASAGKFQFSPGSQDPGFVDVLGHVQDVLMSRITEEKVNKKKFSSKEFSIGLGGLGAGVDEVMPVMGEMMTIGGTMVWLPTDGSDTPDYLVPSEDSDQVLIHTGFNASLSGPFNEFFEFEAHPDKPATLTSLYRALFDRARDQRPDYRGALWLSLRAEMSHVFGSGVVRSPIAAHAPENGLAITDPANFPSWFEYEDRPKQTDVTGLVCGLGLDLDADLTAFNPERIGAAFYVNPANTKSSREMLHNHGVFFSPQPLGETPYELEREIDNVVRHGDFLDMRHLLDRSTIVWALGGISYIQDFRLEPISG